MSLENKILAAEATLAALIERRDKILDFGTCIEIHGTVYVVAVTGDGTTGLINPINGHRYTRPIHAVSTGIMYTVLADHINVPWKIVEGTFVFRGAAGKTVTFGSVPFGTIVKYGNEYCVKVEFEETFRSVVNLETGQTGFLGDSDKVTVIGKYI